MKGSTYLYTLLILKTTPNDTEDIFLWPCRDKLDFLLIVVFECCRHRVSLQADVAV